MASSVPKASEERSTELATSLAEIRSRVQSASSAPSTLVAVSKLKPASDILSCYEHGHRDFGENYIQELVDKAAQLPGDINWHFHGTLQSNKAKLLATTPNLHTVQTLSSAKAATALDKALPLERTVPLNVLLQVNTSGEDSKSGLPPLSSSADANAELMQLAKHVVTSCLRLNLQGLMTIGALSESLNADDGNKDFETLKETRDYLAKALEEDSETKGKYNGKLLLSMGMSSDFEAALKAGSDIVRVGTGIFGARTKS